MPQVLDYSRVGTEEHGGISLAPRAINIEAPLPRAGLDTLDMHTRNNKGERASWEVFQQGDSMWAFLDTTLGSYTAVHSPSSKYRLFFSNLIWTGEQTSTEVILLDGWARYKATHRSLYKHGRARDRDICLQNIADMQAKYADKFPNLNQFSGKPIVPTRRAQQFMIKAMLESAICADYMDLAEASASASTAREGTQLGSPSKGN